MQPLLSVIICTHNPRRDYLNQALNALASQSLPMKDWEILLIDNASETVLASEINLSWHPYSRHIREEALGLTHARLRGIKEAGAEIIVFVDDDNVLDPDYLEIALKISKDFPIIGVWGGQTPPKFDEPPPEWTKPYWPYLAIHQFERDNWSNSYNSTHPCGAGMCVRKPIAEKYADLVLSDPKRSKLGRKGKTLLACEDVDLAFTGCDLGFGVGRFVSLQLTHLMPNKRLQEEYLLRVVEGAIYSHVILTSFRNEVPTLPKMSWKTVVYNLYLIWRMTSRERRFYYAKKRGELSAIRELNNSLNS